MYESNIKIMEQFSPTLLIMLCEFLTAKDLNTLLLLCRWTKLIVNQSQMIAKKFINWKPTCVKHLSMLQRDDQHLMEYAVRKDFTNFRYSSLRLRRNLEFIFIGINIRGENIQWIERKLRENRHIAIRALEDRTCDTFKWIPECHYSDHDVMTLAVERRGQRLELASAVLRDDEDFVMLALQSSPRSARFASQRLLSDPKFVLFSLRLHGMNIVHASASLQKNPSIAAAAVMSCCRVYSHILPLEMRCVREVALAAIISAPSSGYLLELVRSGNLPPALMDDGSVVAALLGRSGACLEYVSDRLRSDAEIAWRAFISSHSAVRFMAESLLDDEEFILRLTAVNSTILSYISPRLLSCNVFADRVAHHHQLEQGAIAYFSTNIRGDFNIMRRLIEKKGSTISFGTAEIKRNVELVKLAVAGPGGSPEALKALDPSFFLDVQTTKGILLACPLTLRYMPKHVRDNKTLVLFAAEQNPLCLASTKTPFKDDVTFAISVIEFHQDEDLIRFFSSKVRANSRVIEWVFRNDHL